MKVSKTTLAAVALSLLIGFAFGQGFNIILKHQGPRVTANGYVIMETLEGVDRIDFGNTITDIGENYVCNIVGWNNVTGHNETKWIAVGNSTIVQTKTKLDTEATTSGFDRALATISGKWFPSGDRAVNYTKKFTSTATITINAVALHWSDVDNSDNNMFALAAITQTTFPTGSNCTVVWSITYNAN